MFSWRIMKGFPHFSHDKFWVNKDKFTQAGFELSDWRAGALATELTIALYWWSPYFVNIFVRGAPIRSIKPWL